MMIDYQKLKEALSIAEFFDERCSIEICFFKTGNPKFVFNTSKPENSFCSKSIDDLIAKLRELTKPEPKYQIGDIVWHINDEDEVCSFLVNQVVSDQTGCSYEHDCDNPEWWLEDQLYPSREALIQAQIDYWQSLANSDDSSPNSENIDCEHKRSGPYFQRNVNEVIEKRCKHCGEFYK
jgi:hypothetical protein